MSIYFKWTEEMSVGDSTIDSQHKNLLSQLNKIIDAAMFGANSTQVTEAIEFLEKYIKEHLEYEEKYMLDNEYPGIEDHKKRHGDFSSTYKTFTEKLKQDLTPEELIFEIEEFLGKWWIEHIGREDKKYYLYIRDNKQ